MHRSTAIVVVVFAVLHLAAAPASKPAVDADHKVVKGPGNRFQITIPKDWDGRPASGEPNQFEVLKPSGLPTPPRLLLGIYTFAPNPRTTIESSRASILKGPIKLLRDEAVDVGGMPGRMFVTERPFTPKVKNSHGQIVDGPPGVMYSLHIYVYRRPWSFSIFGGEPKDKFDDFMRDVWSVLNTMTYPDAPRASLGTPVQDAKHKVAFAVPRDWKFDKAASGESSRVYTRDPDAKPPMPMDQLEVMVTPEKAGDLDAVVKAAADEVKSKSPDAEVRIEPAALGAQAAQRITYDSVDANQKLTTTRIIALKGGQRYEIRLTCDPQRAVLCAGALDRVADSFKL
jgi:hypothetical protein